MLLSAFFGTGRKLFLRVGHLLRISDSQEAALVSTWDKTRFYLAM